MKRKRERSGKLPRSIRRLFPHLKDAVDATEPIEVSVTQNDCDAGKAMQAGECAMAVAAKRQYKADGIVIGVSASYLIKGTRAIRYQTPASVAREIVSFDRHHDFAPGNYKLSAVSPARRFGVNTHQKGGGHKSKRIVHHHTVRVRELEKGVEKA